MDNVENQVQKHLISFCRLLPVHVQAWRSVLQESTKPLQTLVNLCEQQRHVSRVKLDDSDDIRSTLLFQISKRIEDELVIIKEMIDKLNKCNIDLNNKLLTFERSTLLLEFEEDSELIRGNGSQPSLARLLETGLVFLIFFLKNAKNITDHFKNLDLNDEEFIRNFQKAFDVNLDHEDVITLMALTQYVDNVKAII